MAAKQQEVSQKDNGQQEDVRPDQVVAVVLKQARELQRQKQDLFKRIGSNRSMLRSLVENGAATNEQADAITKLYPPKTRKPKGDAETKPETKPETEAAAA